MSHALLRPPESGADIKAAQRALGVSLPDDLVASLRCHDGGNWARAPMLSHHGPPAGVADIVRTNTDVRLKYQDAFPKSPPAQDLPRSA
ncbi:SMI1/KNR4 family protein [Streptomyces sp. HMX87]|uniref:SMI1/KNR4 family protein n=1 Tax=Streptomyces sp. HMX87 TaxID=3390849 RepID=UPI003A84101A